MNNYADVTALLHTEGLSMMDLVCSGALDLLNLGTDTTVYSGKNYFNYSLAVLYTLRKGLELKRKECVMGIPDIAEYGVPAAIRQELDAVKHALRLKTPYL